jgi:lipoprotein-anchoring transpeptidase ErfK/SrfK
MKRREPIVDGRQCSTRGNDDVPDSAKRLSTALSRVHGAVERWTIGSSVSGCIRMINHDAIDLCQHTALGVPVVVLPSRL